jgi:hypothetical protein
MEKSLQITPLSIKPCDLKPTSQILIPVDKEDRMKISMALIRQYIPKSRPLSTVSNPELAKIESLLNNRSRKRLGYKKSLEVFTELIKTFAIRM